MIIVLEGTDGSGKSTLAKQLMREYGLKYHHEGVPPKDISALDHYGRVLEDIRLSRDNYVLDRYALGERVYGPLYRQIDGLGDDGWLVVQRLIKACGAVQILCVPSYETCYKAWSSGRDEMVKNEQLFQSIYNRYLDFTEGQIVYDWEQAGAYEQLLEEIRIASPPLHWAPGIVGSIYARYLFVGDVGSSLEPHVDLPFWGTKNSCKYLTEALHEAGYSENEIALVNAYYVNGDVGPLPLNNLKQEKMVVIALGNRPAGYLRSRRNLLDFHSLPHPQFYNRFRMNARASYVELLRRCRVYG